MGSELCPGCGGKGELDGGASYWQCGSHDRRGFFYQSDLCEARARIAELTKEVERLRRLLDTANSLLVENSRLINHAMRQPKEAKQ